MSTNQNTNEEEVDLGSLFKIIGKGFSNFFNFIGNVFKGIFHGVIVSLLFIKKHFVFIGIGALLGALLGFYLESNKKQLYKSELLLVPNFNTTRELYDVVAYYNELVSQNDTITLAEIFHMDKSSVKSLKSFSIEKVKNERDIINSYDEFVLEVDSVTVGDYEFKDYKSSFSDYDYKMHKITVIADKNDVFRDLGNNIVSSIVENKYFSRYKELSNKNLNNSIQVLRNDLNQIDSLSKVYMEVLLQESKKQVSGTNIDLGARGNKIKELELFETKKDINEDLNDLIRKKINQYEIINIVSNFKPIGYKIQGIANNYIYILMFTGIILVILIILLKKLNIYISNYTK